MRCFRLVVALAVLLAVPVTNVWAAPEGQATWAAHVSLVPTWFDPGETTTGTQFMVTFALHDALLKPMPGNPMAPSLAEAWTASADGLTYEFRLRKSVIFHQRELAAIVQKHPDRFVALANVPLQAPDAAAEELDYCVKTLGFRGVEIGTNVAGQEVSRPPHAPVAVCYDRHPAPANAM